MKKVFSLFVAVVFLFAFSADAYAHPGGTDSRGGHRNHSTGEYHYHHGYGPHQHEDLDGDGDLDCPFAFVDKTSRSSGGTSASSYTSAPVYTSKPTPVPHKENGTYENPWTLEVVFQILIHWAVLAALVCLNLFVFRPIIRKVTMWITAVRKFSERKHQQKSLRQIEKEYEERYKNGLF